MPGSRTPARWCQHQQISRRSLSVTYQGAIGALLIEFYPDIADHYKKRHAAKLAARASTTP